MLVYRVQKGLNYIQSDCATYCDGGQKLAYGYNDNGIVFVYEYQDEEIESIINDAKGWAFELDRDTVLIGEVDDEYVREAEDEDGLVALWNKISWNKTYSF